MEKDCTGSQGPQQTAVLEEQEKREKRKNKRKRQILYRSINTDTHHFKFLSG
jgi:hypothetical protein